MERTHPEQSLHKLIARPLQVIYYVLCIKTMPLLFYLFHLKACQPLNYFQMKYYNKTRTIEDKVTDRHRIEALNLQNELLQKILNQLQEMK